VTLSKRASWFLVAFAVWSWGIWPTFLKNIWKDPRSWHHGPTGFFLVHLVLTVVSLVLGTAIGVLGVRGLRGRRAGTSGGDDADASGRALVGSR
jgi:hypothetical protein